LRAVIISRGGIPTSALPRWREVRKWEMRLKVRIQLIELVFLAHGVVISTNVPLVIISVIRVCTHALMSPRYCQLIIIELYFFNINGPALSQFKRVEESINIYINKVIA